MGGDTISWSSIMKCERLWGNCVISRNLRLVAILTKVNGASRTITISLRVRFLRDSGRFGRPRRLGPTPEVWPDLGTTTSPAHLDGSGWLCSSAAETGVDVFWTDSHGCYLHHRRSKATSSYIVSRERQLLYSIEKDFRARSRWLIITARSPWWSVPRHLLGFTPQYRIF